MKANAPEKIYVYIPDDDIVGTASTQKGFPHQFVTEEYHRIDAFVEKACEWLEENKDHPLIGCEDSCLSGYLTSSFIEDFRKAMKGK